MLLTGLGWAVSSPVQGSPDEDYHLGSIWCPRPADGSCKMDTVNGKPVVRVPIAVASDIVDCYTFKSSISAGCVPGYQDSEIGWSARFDKGAYPIGYYHFHHLFVGKDAQTSVLVMRGVNVLIAVALLGTVGFCAPQRLKRPLIGAVAASWIPWGLFHLLRQSQFVGHLGAVGVRLGTISGNPAGRAFPGRADTLCRDRCRHVPDISV